MYSPQSMRGFGRHWRHSQHMTLDTAEHHSLSSTTVHIAARWQIAVRMEGIAGCEEEARIVVEPQESSLNLVAMCRMVREGGARKP